MKRLNYKTILLLLITITSICLGNIQIKTYIENSNLTTTTEDEPSPSAGPANLAAWIIIAGDRESDHDKLSLIRSGCDKVYEALINRGFLDSQICYLDPEYTTAGNPHSPYYDWITNLGTIQYAITTWAPTRGVDATHGLGIYLFDHGGGNVMCIPGTDLKDSFLDTYLNSLETSTGCNRIVILYEACHSGSFINPVSKDNRIIVTSTDSPSGAHTNSISSLVMDWALFSEKFWSSVIECKTIGECFEDATAHVHSFYDDQWPLIDDNHDEVGNIGGPFFGLPMGGDGYDALNYWIGTGSNCPATSINFFPYTMYMKLGISLKPIWAVVENNSLIRNVYTIVIPPNWTPSEMVSDDEGSTLIEDTGVLLIELHDDDGDGNFTGNLYDRTFWNTTGDYKAKFYARSQDGTVADIQSTCITVNDDGKAPPDTTLPTISILNPVSNANVSDVINITAEGDDDQALDKIQLLLDGVLLKEESMPPYYPYPQVIYNLTTTDYVNGLHNLTAISVDNANNVNQTSLAINIQNGLQIPGFQITTLFIGSLIGVIIISIMYVRKNRNRKIK